MEQIYFSSLGIQSGNVLFENPLLFYFGGNCQSIQFYDNQAYLSMGEMNGKLSRLHWLVFERGM